jgi:hypothetical protein
VQKGILGKKKYTVEMSFEQMLSAAKVTAQ